MSFRDLLAACVVRNNSLLCVGLDPDADKLPRHLAGSDAVFNFNRGIIDATAELVCAFKPNSAFYEANGASGVEQLKKTCDYLKENYPHIPLILDFKRADIDNTNNGYAAFAFEYLKVDAITVNPYLGGQAIAPFLEYKDKGIIILCRTSNSGAGEFQDLLVGKKKLYEVVAERARDEWNSNNNCLMVVGATYPDELARLRTLMGNDFVFLVPGIGAQGGEVVKTVKAGINSSRQGLIINSSRGIIFASNGKDFAAAAESKARGLRDEINKVRGT